MDMTENKKLKARVDANGAKLRYVVNPYYIIMYNGKPYLICATEPHDDVAIYRIDLMSEITTEIKASHAKDGKND